MSGIHELRAYCESIGCACHADEPMSRHTSFKIGGPADLLVRPADAETAAKVMRRAGELGVALTIIGRGSDLLVSDEGIRGAVLSFDEQAAKPGCKARETIFCPAGASLTALCVFAWQRGLSGLEFAYGIPGSVGGAVYMNAGAYGGEMKDVLESVRCLTPEGGERVLGAAELELSYRHSWFTGRPGHLITGAAFRLQKGDPAAIRAKMDDLMERRKQKQPLEYPSGGSTFKRPGRLLRVGAHRPVRAQGPPGGRRDGQRKARGLRHQLRQRHLPRRARARRTGPKGSAGEDRLYARM